MADKTKDAQEFTAFQTVWNLSSDASHMPPTLSVLLENLDKLDSLSKAEQDALLLKVGQELYKLDQK
jgi:hypothetical protein